MMNTTDMKKILYLHGFASSGASGTVGLLRRELWEKAPPNHRVTIVAPDIPLDPLVALPMLEELAYDEVPDLIIGTSMSRVFHGGHRMDAHIVVHTLLPFIRGLELF